jgi:hypothetical protein
MRFRALSDEEASSRAVEAHPVSQLEASWELLRLLAESGSSTTLCTTVRCFVSL